MLLLARHGRQAWWRYYTTLPPPFPFFPSPHATSCDPPSPTSAYQLDSTIPCEQAYSFLQACLFVCLPGMTGTACVRAFHPTFPHPFPPSPCVPFLLITHTPFTHIVACAVYPHLPHRPTPKHAFPVYLLHSSPLSCLSLLCLFSPLH